MNACCFLSGHTCSILTNTTANSRRRHGGRCRCRVALIIPATACMTNTTTTTTTTACNHTSMFPTFCTKTTATTTHTLLAIVVAAVARHTTTTTTGKDLQVFQCPCKLYAVVQATQFEWNRQQGFIVLTFIKPHGQGNDLKGIM